MAKKFTTLLLSKRLCKDKDIIQAYITSNLQMQSHFYSQNDRDNYLQV